MVSVKDIDSDPTLYCEDNWSLPIADLIDPDVKKWIVDVYLASKSKTP